MQHGHVCTDKLNRARPWVWALYMYVCVCVSIMDILKIQCIISTVLLHYLSGPWQSWASWWERMSMQKAFSAGYFMHGELQKGWQQNESGKWRVEGCQGFYGGRGIGREDQKGICKGRATQGLDSEKEISVFFKLCNERKTRWEEKGTDRWCIQCDGDYSIPRSRSATKKLFWSKYVRSLLFNK